MASWDDLSATLRDLTRDQDRGLLFAIRSGAASEEGILGLIAKLKAVPAVSLEIPDALWIVQRLYFVSRIILTNLHWYQGRTQARLLQECLHEAARVVDEDKS